MFVVSPKLQTKTGLVDLLTYSRHLLSRSVLRVYRRIDLIFLYPRGRKPTDRWHLRRLPLMLYKSVTKGNDKNCSDQQLRPSSSDSTVSFRPRRKQRHSTLRGAILDEIFVWPQSSPSDGLTLMECRAGASERVTEKPPRRGQFYHRVVRQTFGVSSVFLFLNWDKIISFC